MRWMHAHIRATVATSCAVLLLHDDDMISTRRGFNDYRVSHHFLTSKFHYTQSYALQLY
jgi:hypothetical protein